VRQAAFPRGIVHVARVDICRVAEDRRIRPLADQQRQPVRKHLGRDPLLKALEILAQRTVSGHCRQRYCQKHSPKPGKGSALHPCSFGAVAWPRTLSSYRKTWEVVSPGYAFKLTHPAEIGDLPQN